MADIAVRVFGDKELSNALERGGILGNRRSLHYAALWDAAGPIRAEAMSRAPHGAGSFGKHLADSIRRGLRRGEPDPTVAVGPTKFTGIMIEEGTRPHEIKPRRADALKMEFGFSRYAEHPGTPARPFLRPAFDARIGEAFDIYVREVWGKLRHELMR